jgi:hypothetical protein
VIKGISVRRVEKAPLKNGCSEKHFGGRGNNNVALVLDE